MIAGTTYCLAPARRIVRAGLSREEARAEIRKIPKECAHPDRCANRQLGCQKTNAQHLKVEFEREDARLALQRVAA